MVELPESARIGAVELRVADADRVGSFYTDVVGLDRLEGVEHGDSTADTERDDATGDAEPRPVTPATAVAAVYGAGSTPLVRLVEAPDAPGRGDDEAGLFHVAFRVPSAAALGAALRRIDASGTQLTGASDHLVSEALYLRDPEGNGVEIYRDLPRDRWPETRGRVRMDSLSLDLGAVRSAGEAAAPGGSADSDRVTDTDGGPGSVPPGTTVGHVHLESTSLSRAAAFYADTVGFRIRQRMGDAALFLAAGDYHHHLGFNTWNGRSGPRNADALGLASFDLLVPDADALASLRTRLTTAGETVVDPAVAGTDPEPRPFQVTDPDGITFRVAIDGE